MKDIEKSLIPGLVYIIKDKYDYLWIIKFSYISRTNCLVKEDGDGSISLNKMEGFLHGGMWGDAESIQFARLANNQETAWFDKCLKQKKSPPIFRGVFTG